MKLFTKVQQKFLKNISLEITGVECCFEQIDSFNGVFAPRVVIFQYINDEGENYPFYAFDAKTFEHCDDWEVMVEGCIRYYFVHSKCWNATRFSSNAKSISTEEYDGYIREMARGIKMLSGKVYMSHLDYARENLEPPMASDIFEECVDLDSLQIPPCGIITDIPSRTLKNLVLDYKNVTDQRAATVILSRIENTLSSGYRGFVWTRN